MMFLVDVPFVTQPISNGALYTKQCFLILPFKKWTAQYAAIINECSNSSRRENNLKIKLAKNSFREMHLDTYNKDTKYFVLLQRS